MATTPAIPDIAAILKQLQGAGISVHGPYEDLGIKAIDLFLELIKGQSEAQRITLWQGWIDVWKPILDLAKGAK